MSLNQKGKDNESKQTPNNETGQGSKVGPAVITENNLETAGYTASAIPGNNATTEEHSMQLNKNKTLKLNKELKAQLQKHESNMRKIKENIYLDCQANSFSTTPAGSRSNQQVGETTQIAQAEIIKVFEGRSNEIDGYSEFFELLYSKMNDDQPSTQTGNTANSKDKEQLSNLMQHLYAFYNNQILNYRNVALASVLSENPPSQHGVKSIFVQPIEIGQKILSQFIYFIKNFVAAPKETGKHLVKVDALERIKVSTLIPSVGKTAQDLRAKHDLAEKINISGITLLNAHNTIKKTIDDYKIFDSTDNVVRMIAKIEDTLVELLSKPEVSDSDAKAFQCGMKIFNALLAQYSIESYRINRDTNYVYQEAANKEYNLPKTQPMYLTTGRYPEFNNHIQTNENNFFLLSPQLIMLSGQLQSLSLSYAASQSFLKAIHGTISSEADLANIYAHIPSCKSVHPQGLNNSSLQQMSKFMLKHNRIFEPTYVKSPNQDIHRHNGAKQAVLYDLKCQRHINDYIKSQQDPEDIIDELLSIYFMKGSNDSKNKSGRILSQSPAIHEIFKQIVQELKPFHAQEMQYNNQKTYDKGDAFFMQINTFKGILINDLLHQLHNSFSDKKLRGSSSDNCANYGFTQSMLDDLMQQYRSKFFNILSFKNGQVNFDQALKESTQYIFNQYFPDMNIKGENQKRSEEIQKYLSALFVLLFDIEILNAINSHRDQEAQLQQNSDYQAEVALYKRNRTPELIEDKMYEFCIEAESYLLATARDLRSQPNKTTDASAIEEFKQKTQKSLKEILWKYRSYFQIDPEILDMFMQDIYKHSHTSEARKEIVQYFQPNMLMHICSFPNMVKPETDKPEGRDLLSTLRESMNDRKTHIFSRNGDKAEEKLQEIIMLIDEINYENYCQNNKTQDKKKQFKKIQKQLQALKINQFQGPFSEDSFNGATEYLESILLQDLNARQLLYDLMEKNKIKMRDDQYHRKIAKLQYPTDSKFMLRKLLSEEKEKIKHNILDTQAFTTKDNKSSNKQSTENQSTGILVKIQEYIRNTQGDIEGIEDQSKAKLREIIMLMHKINSDPYYRSLSLSDRAAGKYTDAQTDNFKQITDILKYLNINISVSSFANRPQMFYDAIKLIELEIKTDDDAKQELWRIMKEKKTIKILSSPVFNEEPVRDDPLIMEALEYLNIDQFEEPLTEEKFREAVQVINDKLTNLSKKSAEDLLRKIRERMTAGLPDLQKIKYLEHERLSLIQYYISQELRKIQGQINSEGSQGQIHSEEFQCSLSSNLHKYFKGVDMLLEYRYIADLDTTTLTTLLEYTLSNWRQTSNSSSPSARVTPDNIAKLQDMIDNADGDQEKVMQAVMFANKIIIAKTDQFLKENNTDFKLIEQGILNDFCLAMQSYILSKTQHAPNLDFENNISEELYNHLIVYQNFIGIDREIFDMFVKDVITKCKNESLVNAESLSKYINPQRIRHICHLPHTTIREFSQDKSEGILQKIQKDILAKKPEAQNVKNQSRSKLREIIIFIHQVKSDLENQQKNNPEDSSMNACIADNGASIQEILRYLSIDRFQEPFNADTFTEAVKLIESTLRKHYDVRHELIDVMKQMKNINVLAESIENNDITPQNTDLAGFEEKIKEFCTEAQHCIVFQCQNSPISEDQMKQIASIMYKKLQSKYKDFFQIDCEIFNIFILNDVFQDLLASQPVTAVSVASCFNEGNIKRIASSAGIMASNQLKKNAGPIDSEQAFINITKDIRLIKNKVNAGEQVTHSDYNKINTILKQDLKLDKLVNTKLLNVDNEHTTRENELKKSIFLIESALLNKCESQKQLWKMMKERNTTKVYDDPVTELTGVSNFENEVVRKLINEGQETNPNFSALMQILQKSGWHNILKTQYDINEQLQKHCDDPGAIPREIELYQQAIESHMLNPIATVLSHPKERQRITSTMNAFRVAGVVLTVQLIVSITKTKQILDKYITPADTQDSTPDDTQDSSLGNPLIDYIGQDMSQEEQAELNSSLNALQGFFNLSNLGELGPTIASAIGGQIIKIIKGYSDRINKNYESNIIDTQYGTLMTKLNSALQKIIETTIHYHKNNPPESQKIARDLRSYAVYNSTYGRNQQIRSRKSIENQCGSQAIISPAYPLLNTIKKSPFTYSKPPTGPLNRIPIVNIG